MSKKKATLESIKIRCPKTDKLVTVSSKKLTWYANNSECEMCGSHGHIEVSVNCSCGKTHDIELYEW